MNHLIGGVIGAIIGGIIGAAIWAGITYGTGYEVGWIAWGVGGLVGAGGLVGSRGNGGVPMGVMAAAIALASILAGKFIAVQMLVDKFIGEESGLIDAFGSSFDDDEFVISYIADSVAEEYVAAGKPVEWPAGVDPEYAAEESDYPADVWADAQTRWDAMSVDAREQYRSDMRAYESQRLSSDMASLRTEATQEGFVQSFGLLDIVFFLLAVATAFKLGSAEQTAGAAS